MTGVIRGFSGVLAGGVIVLMCVVIGASMLGTDRGFPGPGTTSLTWHVGAAIVVVVAQLAADRARGGAVVGWATVVCGVAGLLLWTQWWS
ncbi:hypothetical protein [Nocardia camponoti]|uniref:Uncharacterized protein n=1 Tax=Nocardia camponoti TaxID=1616106 RepID=A0A917V7U1_9NOCA|nr:hypothetical protein [Nocardia camponoti]GGK47373.1 hypothetical protein GCM10011591_18340 [Nocardia camponoti]